MDKYKDRCGKTILPVKMENYEVNIQVVQFDSQIASFDCDVSAPQKTDPIALIQLALDEYKQVVKSTEERNTPMT